MPLSAPDTLEQARPRVGILCLSAIPDDPRVRRQGDVLSASGWDVTAIGLPGARSPAPDWTCISVGVLNRQSNGSDSSAAPRAQSTSFARRAFRFCMRQLYRAKRVVSIVRSLVQPSYAASTFWGLNVHFPLILAEARKHKVDLWLANDWTTLPIAARLAAEQGVPYVYDTHEFASDEYGHRLLWRLTARPAIASVERSGLQGAAVAMCVSDGIAERLQHDYRLKNRPLVIRNIPSFAKHEFRPVGDRIEVLYHGVVAPGRGLEECIRSVALWRPEFRLTIRGPSSSAYRDELEKIAREASVVERVRFADPVPMVDLVREAAGSYVGLFALPGHSFQNVYVLPNKFFEYIMAGLALCVTDAPEMKRLLTRHDLGVTIGGMSPEAIAAAVNSLDRASINRFKRNALISACELNWEREAERFVSALEDVVRMRAS